ncbi:MAG: hypothetical protein K8F25_13285, partial [Fimbriimonadaceae bacterium]|nr:hypothetical protein [Alphaproteobacteria bacterium]
MLTGFRIKDQRPAFQVVEAFEMQITDKAFFSKSVGQTFKDAPKCVTDLLVSKKLVTRTISKSAREDYQTPVDLGRPFSLDELSKDGCGNVRITVNCFVNWNWIDDQGRFDGADQMTAQFARWIQEDIAKAIIEAGAGEALP